MQSNRRPMARLAVVLAAPLAMLTGAGAASAMSSAPVSSTWSVNGSVLSSAAGPGESVYVGGTFDMVGAPSGGAVPTVAATGALAPAFAQVAGRVNAVVADGSGGWYLGGLFSAIGGQPVRNLAHVRSDLTLDAAWAPNPNNAVNALAVSGATVYVGGSFGQIGGQTRGNLAAVGASGTATPWNPNANGTVFALASAGGTVYVGGTFTAIGGQARNRIAGLDSTVNTNNATGWNPNANAAVNALAVVGTTVYAGGSFTTVGGQARNRIAAIDSTVNTNNATLWNPNANNTVFALAVSATTVYAGGSFTTIGGQTRNRIAALNAAVNTNNATLWNPASNGTVTAVALSGGTVYAGGTFTTIGGQGRLNAASLDSAVNTNNATAWNPRVGRSVNAIAANAGTVYVGGTFSVVNGQLRNNIAHIDLATGQATAWDPNASGAVNTLARSGGTVYAGGAFTTIGGQARNRIAALDIATNINNATPWNPNANGTVSTILAPGTIVYVGGAFTTVGGQTRNRIAALDPSVNTNNATTWNPNANGTVSALAIDAGGSTIYAGGSFTSVGGQTRNRIAALVATLATNNATPWDPSANGAVNAVALDGSTVYVGGAFTSVGGQTRSNIAALDANADANNATDWDPAANGNVNALAVIGSTVHAGGAFTSIGGATRNRVAALDATVDIGNATPWNPNLNGTVWSLLAKANNLVVGGAFTARGSEARGALAYFVEAPVNTTLPAVSGTFLVGQTLSCSNGAWIGSPSGYTFQWRRDGTPIAGATASTYVVVAADADRDLVCRVTATNVGGSTSADSAAVHIQGAPVNTAIPTISGTFALGQVLTCSNGTWTNAPVFTREWLRGGSPIAGETASTYTVVADDVDQALRCRVTAMNPAGSATADSADVTPYGVPANTALPTVTGTIGLGEVLTCQPGTWTGPVSSRSYAWLRDGAPIVGETTTTYTITAQDPGSELRCRETATNIAGSAAASSDPLSVPSPPVNATLPTISGTPAVGATLTCQPGTWTNPVASYDYAWLLDGTPIAGETTTTYTVLAGDADLAIACRETATSPTGSASASSAPVNAYAAPVLIVAPQVSGAPAVGQTLTCDPGTWQYPVASRAYEWLNNGTPIAGATSTTYTVLGSDAGDSLRCREQATNAAGTSTATSAPVGAYDAPANLTAPVLSGEPGVGLVLTCVPGTWQYPVGSLSYAWLRDGAPIGGETSTTYAVVPADASHDIACRETATNPAGSGSATSSAVTAYGPAVNQTLPLVSGDPAVGQVITCDPGTWTGRVDSRGYSWLRDGAAIAGATSATYTVTPADAGRDLNCREFAGNPSGNAFADSASVVAYDVPVNLTLPSVSGEPAVGQVLTCVPGIWAGNVTSRSYAWLRDGSPISGETSATHTLVAGDAGRVITCRETATNTAGSASADATGVNAYGVAVNLTAPSVTGEPGVGLDLTCDPGTWSGRVDSRTYAWLRDGSPLASQTALTYTVVGADDGHAIACRETTTNPAGDATQDSSAVNAYGPATVGTLPQVTGSPAVGATLTCVAGTWNGRVDTTVVAWLRDGSEVAGETASTYSVVGGDAGHDLRCRISATNPSGTTQATSATVSAYDAPESLALPAISGTPFAGQVLTCDPGTWRYPVVTSAYLWTKDGSPIAGATSATYTVLAGDLDGVLRCRETVTNAAGSTAATSSPVTVFTSPQLVTPPGISGTPGVGQTLSCLPGVWQYPVPVRSYQWLRDGNPIGGATSGVYVVAVADAGHIVSCEETATNPAGSASSTSGQLSAFDAPVLATGPVLSGDPAVGASLSCTTATWAGTYPIDTITRSWLRDGTPIAGETGLTHTVVAADAGHLIACRDTATNGAGPTNATSGTLSAYDAPLSIVAPFLVGEPVAGQLVTCNTGTFQYPTPTRFIEWLRDGSLVSGATGPTFVISTLDAGHGIRCRVTAINNAGTTQVRSAQVTAYDKPVNQVAPSVTGTPAVGQILTCVGGSWQYPVVTTSTQWLRDGAPIPGASASTYTLQAVDAPHQISCRETATNAGGSVAEESDQIAAYDKPASRNPPRVAGPTSVGQTLTCESGTWTNPVLTRSYEWLRDGSLTSMASGRTYVVTADDAGHYIRCRERASNDAGAATATSAAVVIDIVGTPSTPDGVAPVGAPVASVKPSIQGERRVGAIVSCNGGQWTSDAALSYRWLRGSTAIAGATASTYTLTAADAPSGVRCEVTATSTGGRTTLTVATGTIAGQAQAAVRTDDIPNAMVLTIGGVRVVLPRSLSRGSLTKTKLIRFRVFSSGPATVSVRIGGRTVVSKLLKGGTTPRQTIKVASRITPKLKRLSFRVEVTTSGPKSRRVGLIPIKGRATAK